jgi:hypothetical protein
MGDESKGVAKWPVKKIYIRCVHPSRRYSRSGSGAGPSGYVINGNPGSGSVILNQIWGSRFLFRILAIFQRFQEIEEK